MAIDKIHGITYLDSGTVFLGDDAVVEIVVKHKKVAHQVAIKLRQDGGEPQVRFGSPKENRTVVHLTNLPQGSASGGAGIGIGPIRGDNLYLTFELVLMPGPGYPRRLTFMLYVA